MRPTVEQLMAARNPRLTVPGLRLPDGIKPHPYQYIDATFACLYPRSIIAEYPAAGKKLIAIMASLKLFSLFKARNALVVSLGADCEQWMEELHRFTDGCHVQLYRGTPDERRRMRHEEPDYRVTSYHTAVADTDKIMGMHDIVLLDEVSYLKNFESHAHEELRRLLVSSSFNWGLSATPYETSPMDLFSLMWVLVGPNSPLGAEERGVRRYKQMHCVVNKFRIKVQNPKTKKYRSIRIEKVVGAVPESLPHLKEKIRDYYIRHPWDIVAKHLPPLDVEPIWIDLSKKQADRYREIMRGRLVADFVYRDRGIRISEKQVNAAIKHFYAMRCCDGLFSLPAQSHRDSTKMQKCMSLLTGELAGEKVVVFSRFHAPLDQLERRFPDEGITWCRIDGNSPDDGNQARREFMTKKGPRVLLMTEKGRYALNLQIANYGIAYNTLYNPKKLTQLYGRIRRPGPNGERDPKIWYHLLCRDTVEEAQWVILRNREGESGELFGDDEELFSTLTPSEQNEILLHGIGLEALAA